MPLQYLSIAGNQLTTLDLVGEFPLETFYSRGNKFTTLGPFLGKPPQNLTIDLFAFPDSELKQVAATWKEIPGQAVHVANAQTLLAMRRNDPAGLKALATPFGGHRYLVVPQWMTWRNAKSFCGKMGGHLATVTSKEEQQAIRALPCLQDEELWLGLSRDTERPTWVTGEPVGYTAFSDASEEKIVGFTYLNPPSLTGWRTRPASEISAKAFVLEWDEP
jgi:hypothetical protein